MSESLEYHKLIDLGTDLEKAVRSTDGKLNYLFIFHSDGELIIEAFYSNPNDINSEMVGGLIAAINGFAGGVEEGNTRLVVLQKVKFIFTSVGEVLLVIAYENEMDDDKAKNIMKIVMDSFILSYKHELEVTEEQPVDTIACTALSKIFQLIDDEIVPEYKLGKKSVLDLDLIEYEASKRIQLLFDAYRDAEEKSKKEESPPDLQPKGESPLIDFDEPRETAPPLPDVSGDPSVVPTPQTSVEKSYEDKADPDGEAMIDAIIQMEKILDQMIARFESLVGLTVLRNHEIYGLETIEKGDLSPEVFEKLQSTVLENMGVIQSLLEGTLEDRILELDNYYMFLQRITQTSFMYLIFRDKDSIELIQPIIERVANTISSIYPD